MALLSFESMNHEWKQRMNDWEKERSGFTIEKQKFCKEKQCHFHNRNHAKRVAHQISMHSKQTGASAAEGSQWIMCTLSADL